MNAHKPVVPGRGMRCHEWEKSLTGPGMWTLHLQSVLVFVEVKRCSFAGGSVSLGGGAQISWSVWLPLRAYGWASATMSQLPDPTAMTAASCLSTRTWCVSNLQKWHTFHIPLLFHASPIPSYFSLQEMCSLFRLHNASEYYASYFHFLLWTYCLPSLSYHK